MNRIIPRSYLFVPGNRPERFDKACASQAGAVIIDLEDAVQPDGKAQARDHAARWLRPEHRVLVRINSAGSEWFQDDARLCALPGVDGIVLPKAERTEDIALLALAAPGKPIFPLVESALGFAHARALAGAPHVSRLMFGSIDFQLDTGIEGDDMELACVRSELVLASRLAGIAAPVDGVTVALNDTDLLRADTLRARRFGFGAKLCIHPLQVEHVNAVFFPTVEEVAWARRVLDAAQQSGGAAVALDGKMIDRPVILKAQQLLAEHEGRRS